jgi:hypothetical protein
MGQASAVAAPGASGPGVRVFKAEMDRLRERMRGLGFGYDEITAKISRRYQVRPRETCRLAWGWTLGQAARWFNQSAAVEGTGPRRRASVTGPRLCEVEKWPGSDRKPPVYVLCLLAKVCETGMLCLLDRADHESLPQHDRLMLMRHSRAEIPRGERVLALAEAAGAALDDGPGRQDPGRRASEGMSLILPYVPARLVVEVSGPAGNDGLPAGGSDGLEAAPGRLALVRDHLPGSARTEAAGR